MSALAAPAVPTRPDPVGALSAAQTKAALTLAYGGTVSAAADSVGVHRSSIYNWFKSDPNFKQAVEEIRRDRNERLSDQMRELESLALARLRRLLEDDSVPASVQLRAALAILNRPKRELGTEEWNVPRMESLGVTLDRKPHLADAPRQISTLFADSDPANRPRAIEEGTPTLPRPTAMADSSTGSQGFRDDGHSRAAQHPASNYAHPAESVQPTLSARTRRTSSSARVPARWPPRNAT